MKICTTNAGKLAEYGGMLAPLGIALDPVTEHDVPETGTSFEENGMQKARAYSRLFPDDWILAEDSGIVVPAIKGLPGVWSARFDDLDIATCEVHESGRPRAEMDRANNARLLRLMANIDDDKRGAYFVSHLVIVKPGGTATWQFCRRVHGWVTREARGDGGFGYDPIFVSPESYGKTWAEIDAARKSLISHRNNAVLDMLRWVCSTKENVK